ncbi:hypothetical protein J6E39_06195 [bacterium]|nr:hypothetical protein [bacterium]
MIQPVLSGNYSSNIPYLAKTQPAPVFGNKYTAGMERDTVNISKPEQTEEEKKKKRNKIIKWGAGIAVAGAIIATAIFAKGRTLQPANFSENVEFIKASTMKEAQKFAEKHFGIKLELGDDLEVANWALEGLTNINNKFKGKAQMPKKLIFDEKYFAQKGNEHALAYCTWNENPYIAFNKKAFDSALDRFKSNFHNLENIDSIDHYINKSALNFKVDSKDVSIPLNILDENIVEELGRNIMKLKENPAEFSKFDAIHSNMLYDDMQQAALKIVKEPLEFIEKMFKNEKISKVIKENASEFKTLEEYKKLQKGERLDACLNFIKNLKAKNVGVYSSGTVRGNSQFDILYHEMGHLLHQKNISLYDKEWGKLSNKSQKAFINDEEKQKIAREISWYACKNQKEYVAECFNAIVSGRTLSDKQMEMYRLYKGPEIDKFAA